MKIAVTIWNDRIAPVYDSSKTLLVYETDMHTVVNTSYIQFHSGSAEGKAAFLMSLTIDVLICGAITAAAKEELIRRSIEVHSFIAGDISDIVRGWNKGKLSDNCFSMPGCTCRQRGKCRDQ